MFERQNLSDIKVGDKIIYTCGGFSHYTVIRTVTKVTSKQFVDEYGNKFRKEDGRMIGELFRFCRIATEEDIKQFNELKHRSELRKNIQDSITTNGLTRLKTSDLEAIYEILKQEQ